jgi:toxin ParE1/3/4
VAAGDKSEESELLPIVRRGRADLDTHEQLDFYIADSPAAAQRFLTALEKAFTHIQRAPDTGSPRWGQALDIPGLRAWRCGTHPQLIFYVAHRHRIEVWRVLHGARDIPAWLADESSPL